MSLMMQRYRIKRAVAIAAALCFAVLCFTTNAALAHKNYVAEANIVWNENTFTLEVRHTLMWHDVETVITVRRDKRFSFDLGEAVSVPLMKEYIADRFIIDVDGQYLPLTWVGMTFDEDRLNITYKAKLDSPPKKLIILDGLMTDFFESHKNKVIVEANDQEWVFDLTREDVEVKIDLTQ